MTRREMREHLIKLLFIAEFWKKEELEEQFALYFELFPVFMIEEKYVEQIRTRFGRILENLAEIDQMLEETSKGWKLSRMAKVDLSILRLAAFEMKFDEEVPTGVAINEAVELAKLYGGDDSPAFINGLLGKLSRSPEKKPEENEEA